MKTREERGNVALRVEGNKGAPGLWMSHAAVFGLVGTLCRMGALGHEKPSRRRCLLDRAGSGRAKTLANRQLFDAWPHVKARPTAPASQSGTPAYRRRRAAQYEKLRRISLASLASTRRRHGRQDSEIANSIDRLRGQQRTWREEPWAKQQFDPKNQGDTMSTNNLDVGANASAHSRNASSEAGTTRYMQMIAKGQMKSARGIRPSGADQFYDLAT